MAVQRRRAVGFTPAGLSAGPAERHGMKPSLVVIGSANMDLVVRSAHIAAPNYATARVGAYFAAPPVGGVPDAVGEPRGR